MKSFCINLASATDRHAHCTREFTREGLDVTFVRGFDGRASRLHHEQDWITKQVGACISHIMVVEEIRHSDYGPALVFEDDIVLGENFLQKLQASIATLPSDWDVAALSFFEGNNGAELIPENEDWLRFSSGDVWGQACYLVNGSKGAEKVLDCITPIRSHIDRMFWECCRDGLMTGYFIRNQFVTQTWDFPSQNI